MNRTPRLSKSGIEYLDCVWNFFSGCHNWNNGVCPVGVNCWAKRRTERFNQFYPNGFEPTFYPEAFLSPMSLKKPSIIGVAFMGDLFGDWVNPDEPINIALYGLDEKSIDLAKVGINPIPKFPLKESIYSTIKCCPQHTFVFLTKCPQNLIKWSPFPDNCYVGVTIAKDTDFDNGLCGLLNIVATKRYISFEPLLTRMIVSPQLLVGIDWVIIGAQTKPTVYPKIEWVQEIVTAADKAGIPVFLKDNLSELIPINSDMRYGPAGELRLRQEMPANYHPENK